MQSSLMCCQMRSSQQGYHFSHAAPHALQHPLATGAATGRHDAAGLPDQACMRSMHAVQLRCQQGYHSRHAAPHAVQHPPAKVAAREGRACCRSSFRRSCCVALRGRCPCALPAPAIWSPSCPRLQHASHSLNSHLRSQGGAPSGAIAACWSAGSAERRQTLAARPDPQWALADL